MSKDYYKILGIEKSATDDELKKAYRRLAHKHHPDKKDGDEAKFKEINEAYQVLGDKEKRQKFDQFGSDFDQQGGFGGGMNWSDFMNATRGGGGGGGFSGGFGGIDLGDIFGDMFGGGGGRRRQRRGNDIQVDVRLEFREAVFGVEKEINLTKKARELGILTAYPLFTDENEYVMLKTGEVDLLEHLYKTTDKQVLLRLLAPLVTLQGNLQSSENFQKGFLQTPFPELTTSLEQTLLEDAHQSIYKDMFYRNIILTPLNTLQLIDFERTKNGPTCLDLAMTYLSSNIFTEKEEKEIIDTYVYLYNQAHNKNNKIKSKEKFLMEYYLGVGRTLQNVNNTQRVLQNTTNEEKRKQQEWFHQTNLEASIRAIKIINENLKDYQKAFPNLKYTQEIQESLQNIYI